MAPNPPDRKRKRGRPPGASKVPEDASTREQTEVNDAEVEDESRSKKRGRSAAQHNPASISAPSEASNEAAQPARRGRPAKVKAHATGAQVAAEVENEPKAAEKSLKAKAKASEGQGVVDPPSSELRRSARERRPNTSPTQFTSPPSDSNTMPPPPRRWKLAETAPELPESTPRRSERGRRQWEAKKYFSGNHRTGEQDQAQEHTPVVAKRHDRKRFAAPNDHAAGSTSRKQKLAAANASEEEAAASRARNRKTVGQERRAGKELLSRAPQQQSSDEGLSRARKKKGVAASDKADAPAADYIQPKRRGRKARDDAASEQPEASKPSNSGGPRARPSENQVAEAQSQEPRPVGSKRKTLKPRRSEPKVEHDTDPESSEDDEELPYRYIQEIIRHVSRTIIADKWTPLDTPAIHVICAFLTDIQRSVLLRLQNTTQQRGHGSAALGAITRRLQSRLRKGYPFPAPTTTGSSRANAGSYEDDFDFERVVDAKQALENSLNPLLHSVGLLEREIVKEEAALARDYDQLHTLEANAKSVVSEWREKAKREHLLAPGIKKKGNQEVDARHCLEFVPSHGGRMSGGLFKDLEDEDLATLSQQIGSHMKSMKENLKQIEGILPAIVQSKAALQHVLLQHLDEEQYDNVLLG